MTITLFDAQKTIEENHFSQSRSTSKIIEYKSKSNGRVLYLRLGQGFPQHADIAVHPEVDVSGFVKIDDVKLHKNVFRYSSNMS